SAAPDPNATVGWSDDAPASVANPSMSAWLADARLVAGSESFCFTFSSCRNVAPSRVFLPRGLPDAASPMAAPLCVAPRRRAFRRPRVPHSSAHRFLHQSADPRLFRGGQILEREGDRPHGAFVEVRLVLKAERRIPRFELLSVLKEANHLTILRIRRHP